MKGKVYLKIALISKANIDHGHVYNIKSVNITLFLCPTLKPEFFFLNMKFQVIEISEKS